MTGIENAKAISEIADKLFGRLGAAVFIATLAFFVIPEWLWWKVGLNPDDPGQRRIAGILLVVSAATCFVSLMIRAGGSWGGWRRSFADQLLYARLSPEARIILGIKAQVELSKFYVPKSYEPGQELIDTGLAFATDSSGTTLSLITLSRGDDFVRRYRKRLRSFVMENDALSTQVAKVMQEAEKQPRAGWMSY